MAQAGEDDVLTGAAVPVAPAVTSQTEAPVVRADGGVLHYHVCRVLSVALLTLALFPFLCRSLSQPPAASGT